MNQKVMLCCCLCFLVGFYFHWIMKSSVCRNVIEGGPVPCGLSDPYCEGENVDVLLHRFSAAPVGSPVGGRNSGLIHPDSTVLATTTSVRPDKVTIKTGRGRPGGGASSTGF